MKSEPSELSIDDLGQMPGQTVPWFGVRNYQARNFMLKEMRPGDGVLFYHSSCSEPGIAGLAIVATAAYPDATQFDPESKYFDPKSTLDKPRWHNVDIRLERKIRFIPLVELRTHTQLKNLRILQRGNRLSITPVSLDEWQFIADCLLAS